MENRYKIIVAHPERQHSFYLASAMKKAGMLDKYITTIYDRPQSMTNKIKRFLKGNNQKKANSRKFAALDDADVIQFNELNNLIITFLSRKPIFRDICRRLRDKNGKSFGIKVAKYAINNQADAVIMFDGYAYSCFEYLKRNAPQIKCILDVTIMSRPYTRKVFDHLAKETDDPMLKEENFYLYDNRFLKNFQKEYDLGDYFLVGSSIVKKSVEFCGIDDDKIAMNPYGVDINKFFAVKKEKLSLPLKLIVVGQLNRRKGIHQLLEVVTQYKPQDVFLDLVGSYDETSDTYLKYKNCSNISFHGFITHDTLFKLYQEAHVFVLPSFAEGLALVGLEALASGLPLLCSDCSGVNDLISPYENGIVTRAGNLADIKNGIDWFRNHINEIPEMGINARKTAEKYTWDAYYERTQECIAKFLSASRE